MYAGLLSGALRLPNGNTLIAAGVSGHMFEIGAGNAVVWEFTNPYVEDDDRQSTKRIAAALGGSDDVSLTGDGDDSGAGNGGNRRGGLPRPGSIYRATRISADHPGLSKLRPGSGQDR